ncbi:MAG: CRTAC1 family protein [Armatimonadota bacterium]|nr:CRTAC1 family protein [Armatimonadota bacterium]MDR7440437.1 CRTAC1 family protein [Armatimonadota bacterium]MDR7569329.1 CRTAC1 family protein [Armatimonadota bacterium]MDR7614989.1 CRTAC1 family protein [Armatimonadota bacterium]
MTDQVFPYPVRPLYGESHGQSWGFIAVGDYDGDGWDDLYINEMSMVHTVEHQNIHGRPQSGYLLRNTGGRFVDETYKLPVIDEDTEHRHAAVWCDFDNDGDEDLLLGTGMDDEFPLGHPERMTGNLDVWLRNDGTHFTDVSRQVTVEGYDTRHSKVFHGYTCADVDGNGWPDILLQNKKAPEVYGSGGTPVFRLYLNLGGFRYREAAAERGFKDTEYPTSNIDPWGLGCYDFNGVRGMDCRSAGGNLGRWILNKGGGFFDVHTGVYRPIADLNAYSNDLAWADYNGDGLIDHSDAGLTQIVRIFVNNGSTVHNDGMADSTKAAASNRVRLRSTAALDADNDGDADLFVTVEGSGPQTPDGWTTKAPDLFFRNDNMTFVEMARQVGLDGGICVGKRADSRPADHCAGGGGAAVVDYDRDGRLDLVVSYTPWFKPAGGVERVRVYRNVTQNPGNWIGVIVQGRRSLGSRVTVEACGKTHVRQVVNDTHHLAQNTRAIHVGLGGCTNRPYVVIQWSDGAVTRTYLSRNRYHLVRR